MVLRQREREKKRRLKLHYDYLIFHLGGPFDLADTKNPHKYKVGAMIMNSDQATIWVFIESWECDTGRQRELHIRTQQLCSLCNPNTKMNPPIILQNFPPNIFSFNSWAMCGVLFPSHLYTNLLPDQQGGLVGNWLWIWYLNHKHWCYVVCPWLNSGCYIRPKHLPNCPGQV